MVAAFTDFEKTDKPNEILVLTKDGMSGLIIGRGATMNDSSAIKTRVRDKVFMGIRPEQLKIFGLEPDSE